MLKYALGKLQPVGGMMIGRQLCVALCVFGLSFFSGCSRVDCEGRYQLDDGRCPCAPGVLPELQADGSVVCDDPAPDAQPADAGSSEDSSTGQDAGRPCESEVRYADDDMDGYGDPEQEMSACDAPADWVVDNTDCDDSCITCFPGAEELCDGENNDCADNELVDETFDCELGSTRIACMTSCGSMGVGDCSATCSAPEGDTCIAPAETCNGADDDCDGVIDNGVGSSSSLVTIAGGSVTPTIAPERLETVAGVSGQAIVAFRDRTTRMLYLQRVDSSGAAVGSRVMVGTATAPTWYDLFDAGTEVGIIVTRGEWLEYATYSKSTLETVRAPVSFGTIGDFVTDIRAASDGTRAVVVINDGGTLRSRSVNLFWGTAGTWADPIVDFYYPGQPYSFDIAAAPGGFVLVYSGSASRGGLANRIYVTRLNDQGAVLSGGASPLTAESIVSASESFEDIAVEAGGDTFGVSYIRSSSASSTTAVGDRSTGFLTFTVARDASLGPALIRRATLVSDCAPYPNTRTQQYSSHEMRSGSLTYFASRETFALVCYNASLTAGSALMYRRYLHLLGAADDTRDEIHYPSPAPAGSGAAFRSLRTTAGRTVDVGSGLVMLWAGRGTNQVIESQGFGCF